MIRPGALALVAASLLLGGCFRASLGVDTRLADPHVPFGSFALDYGYFGADASMAATGRLRGGPAGLEVAGGGLACRHAYTGMTFDFCGRVYALELGARHEQFTIGTISPALGVGMAIPVNLVTLPAPGTLERRTLSRSALSATLWLGHDIRAPWAHARPHLGLEIGFGMREMRID